MYAAMTHARTKVPTIPAFVARCDAYCAQSGKSRVWLSKALFNDTSRLEQLATKPDTDVGVRRMEQAVADLEGLERQLKADA